MKTIDAIFVTLIGLAFVAVLVGGKSQTATVIGSATGALASLITSAMSPLAAAGG